MKSMILIITVLALLVPFAANASEGNVSTQCVCKMVHAVRAEGNPAHACNDCQTSAPDLNPYIIHG